MTTSADPRARALDALLDDLSRRFLHAVVAVESGDRSFIWRNARGRATAGGAAMTASTPFHVASIDKLLTATIVMKLAASGTLRLEDPAIDYLPQIEGIHRLHGVDRTPAITIEQLLRHTSGLPDCFEDRPRGGESLMERLFSGSDFAWTLDELLETVRSDLTPHFAPLPPAPHARVRYSDTNYQLLNAMIEAVAAEPLPRVFERMLFRPLQMRHSWFHGRSEPLETTQPPAAITIGGKELARPLALPCFPSLYSTAGDLITFFRALTTGDPETWHRMTAEWHPFAFPRDRASLRAPGWPVAYGLGVMRFRLPRWLTPFHPMPPVLGHSGSTGSWLFWSPDQDVFLCGTVDEATAGAIPYRALPRLLRITRARPAT